MNVNEYMESGDIKNAICKYVERPHVSVRKNQSGVKIEVKHRIGVQQAWGNRASLEAMGFRFLFYFYEEDGKQEKLPYSVRVWI